MKFLIVLAFVCVLVTGIPIDLSEDEPDLNSENFLENGDHFEGDILLTEDQARALNDPKSRNGINNAFSRWPNKVIPYVLPNTFNTNERSIILQSMNTIQSRTCIKFRPRKTESDYITFQNGGGCSSYVGRIGGSQPVTLAVGCRISRIVIHELIHAVGFLHMQSAADRDKYVKILWENIQPGKEYNFQIYRTSLSFNIPYDRSSIMHYTSYAFSKNRKPTITALNGAIIGQSTAMTAYDIRRITSMYQC